MKYFTLAIVSIACLLQQIESHSWLDCTKDVGTGLRTGVNDCRGFPRGYPGRVGGSDIDRVMTHRIQPGIDGQNAPICAPTQQSSSAYSNTYYMATAAPGETLRMRWTPNGHQVGAGQNPLTYVIHWTGTPNTQLTTRLQLTAANKLAGPFKFDETCFCNNCAGDPCYGSFTIPPSTAPGVYSFIWYWVFDRNPTGAGEEYTTCFDVRVTGTNSTQPPQTTRTSQAQTTQRTSQAPQTTRTSQAPQTTQRTSQSPQTTRTSQAQQTSEVETSETPTLVTDQITTSEETGSASVLYNLFPVVCIYVATLLL